MEIRVVSLVLASMVLAGALGGTANAIDAGQPAGVEFARDIQPIFEASCYGCHGSENRKSGLRLDVQAEAMRGGDSGPVISPGDANGSLLYQYVSGADPDTIMPPEGDPLTADKVAAIERWINQGAVWAKGVKVRPTVSAVESDHWSFLPFERPPVPSVRQRAWERNPIDRFILARLEREGIAPSPEADRATLLRRLNLDLIGLPPTPAEVEDFVNDPSPYANERVVNRLLASPHFGERWARHWLDLARYADSDGFEKDNVRPHAWRYRQWVIEAFNRDLPYDQFLIEQLAGDLLPHPTLEQRVATGFHRNTLTNKEGGVDVEQYRVEQIVDRVNTTSSVFLGLTMACAQCHSHKYDPLTQAEYYGMFAFFNSSMEKNVPAPLDSEVVLYAQALEDFEELEQQFLTAINEYKPRFEKNIAEWEAELGDVAKENPWVVLEPESMVSEGGAKFTQLEDGSILVSGKKPRTDDYLIRAGTRLENITGFRLEALKDSSLPKGGPGRAGDGTFALSEFYVRLAKPHDPEDGPKIAIREALAEDWKRSKSTESTIESTIDGDTGTHWRSAGGAEAGEIQGLIFITKEPVRLAGRRTLSMIINHRKKTAHSLGRFRLSVSKADPKYLRIPTRVRSILATATDKRTDEQKETLFDYFGTIDPRMRELQAALAAHERTRPKLTTNAQIIVENPNPPKTNIHIRGDFLRKGEEVEPHVPAVLPPLEPRTEKQNRMDLARWLVRPDHPLTSRVAANRVWEHLFGRGLVNTSEDFGTRGEPPSHPELLDWLASEYMAQGWSTKALIKLVVSSAAYRQASRVRPELTERDPMNLLLARQNRFRVEAEIIRDLFLSASGLLNPTLGGPSVRPPMPKGVAELGYASSVKWRESEGANKYRRGLYILFQRTVPYPMLMTFDCPDSNVSAIRRTRSNTPLQALTLLNDPVFFECAQALGRRVYTKTEGSTEDRIRRLFRLCLARDPNASELTRLVDYWETESARFGEDRDIAARIAGRNLPEGTQSWQVAPWVVLGRTVMNLDEFVTRE